MVKDRIINILTETFAPSCLRVSDESAAHTGHSGVSPGGETHFSVYIESSAFRGKSRLEQQRMVHQALGSAVLDHIHAISLHIQAGG